MLSKLVLFIGVVVIISALSHKVLSANKLGYYTIVAPGTIRSNSVFQVSISLSNYHRSCWFNISLLDNHKDELHNLATVEIQPGATQLLKVYAPYLSEKWGHLMVTGYRGIIIKQFAPVNFDHDSFSTFIQTNKAKYWPGELVQFRVICIDQMTRPARIDRRMCVLVYDGKENLIKRICDVTLVQGVFKGELQLSDLTYLGKWEIKVEVGGDLAAQKSFEVSRFDPPSFHLSINTNSSVVISDEKIHLEIRASYFFGEPVKGSLQMVLYNSYNVFIESIPVLEITSQIDGSTTIVLDIKEDLKMKPQNGTQPSKRLYTWNVKANVTDLHTGQISSADDVEIGVYSQPYKVKVLAPKVFNSDGNRFSIKIRVSITDLLDNPIKLDSMPINIIMQCLRTSYYWSEDFEPLEKKHLLKNWVDDVSLYVKDKNYTTCNLHAKYYEIRSPTEWVKKNVDSLWLDVLTESPEVGKELEVSLTSKYPIGNLSYEIVSRGDIIQTESIEVPNNQKTCVLKLNVTHSMVPKITIFAHHILNGLFVSQLKDVHIKRMFQNSIEIKTDNEAEPGASVYINVTTNEGSYIGLMALDHRVLQAYRQDFTEDLIYTKLRNYESSPFPGITAGLVTFSNTLTEFDIFGGRDSFVASDDKEPTPLPAHFDKPTIYLPRIRKLFSESWLYRDIEKSPSGVLSLLETVPDTITSWAITGFSLNPITGLTLTKNVASLKVFQKFFISLDLPASVKEDETVEIPIYIFNYMSQDVLTNVTIQMDTENVEIFKNPGVTLNSQETITRFISGNGREKIRVFVQPFKSGIYNLTVKAVSLIASDAVQKIFTVKSDGNSYSLSKTFLVNLPEESTQENEIRIDIPEDTVPGSQSVEVSVVGDIFQPLVTSLQKLARFPHGNNGEENMKFIVANFMVLKYFKVLNYSHPNFERKLRLNLELGYQNQLYFKHLDGSFGTYDQTVERSGGILQTAFALWGLHQAGTFIQVDLRIRERGLNYLKSKQLDNGCFKTNSGADEDIRTTAFTLMAFLMDEDSRTMYEEVISKGLGFLYESSTNFTQSSASYLSTYVLLLGKHEKAWDCLKKLTTNEISRKGTKTPWERSDTIQSHLAAISVNLMNLFESQEKQKNGLIDIASALIASDEGIFTLEHMIALHAMIIFIEDLNLNRRNLNISFEDDQSGSGEFKINSENSQVLQTIKLFDQTKRISFLSQGYGFAVIEVKYKYNLVPRNKSSPMYSTKIALQSFLTSQVDVEVCVRKDTNDSDLANLTIIEVHLQSGFIFTEKTLNEIKDLQEDVKSIQLDDDRGKVVIYMNGIDSTDRCLKLKVLRKFKVVDVKPGWVVIFAAHEEDKPSISTFTIPTRKLI